MKEGATSTDAPETDGRVHPPTSAIGEGMLAADNDGDRKLGRAVSWEMVVPVLAVAAVGLSWGRQPPAVVELMVVALLVGSVLAAVHHAEVVAHRVGEPFGSLVLAVAVTVIEVSLIVTLMVEGGAGAATLARDTVFAALMITCNGIVGLSLVVAAARRGMAVFQSEGTTGPLATVATLATLCLVLPSFTTSRPGPVFSGTQLAFAAVASLLLYGLFVFVQTIRYRDYFRPPVLTDPTDSGPGRTGTLGVGRSTGRPGSSPTDVLDVPEQAPPSAPVTAVSLGLLVAALVGVVGLAKVESPTVGAVVAAAGLPHAFVGVVIALLVLLPETLAAVRNAARDRVQVSFNLAFGSAMASIGLTIPAIAIASIWLDGPVVLGLGATQLVLLALTVVVGILTVVPGRAALLRGGVHLVICAAFLFLAANP
jgi:Ca2+:H+ antiporter